MDVFESAQKGFKNSKALDCKKLCNETSCSPGFK